MNEKKFNENIKPYEEEWVAIKNDEVVAHDKNAEETKKKAEEKGYKNFTLFKVPPLARSLAPFLA